MRGGRQGLGRGRRDGVGLDGRNVGMGRTGRTLSKAGLQTTGFGAFLLGSSPASRYIFSFSVPQTLREWLEYFLTEGRVTRCPAL